MALTLPQPHGLLEVALVDIEVAAGGGLVLVLHIMGEVPPVVVRRLGDGGGVVPGVVALDRTRGEAPGDQFNRNILA